MKRRRRRAGTQRTEFLKGKVLIFLFSLTTIFGQKEHSKLEISHLTGDFYVYTTYQPINGNPFPANGLYVITHKGAVIIDSPWDTTQFQPLLDSIKFKHHVDAVICIATHSHEDRTAGLEFYRQKGLKTYTTQQTDAISKQKGKKRAEFLMSKDTIFKLGKYSFEVIYPGEGHAPDNIVVWFEKEKVLYGGCLIKSVEADNLGNLADANMNVYAATLKKVEAKCKNPKFVIPGHQGWPDSKSLEHTLKLVAEKEKTINH